MTLRRWVVQELVTEAVLAQEARAAGITDLGPDERVENDQGTSALPPSAVISLVERVTGSVSVADRDVRAYYDRNQDLYRRRESRRVRHILLPDEAGGRRVAGRIKTGEEMGALAAARSMDEGSRRHRGDLGDVRRGELAGPLEEAIFSAPIGTVFGPIRTEHGWHVARVEAVTPAWHVPFAEARSTIEAELLSAARTRTFEAWLDGRRSALAAVSPEYEHPGHPIHGLPSHRH